MFFLNTSQTNTFELLQKFKLGLHPEGDCIANMYVTQICMSYFRSTNKKGKESHYVEAVQVQNYSVHDTLPLLF